MEPQRGKENEYSKDLPEKLERRFGTGSKPEARRAFYRRLELATEIHGERVWTQLRIVAAECDGKREPGRYFCKTALLRLREAGLLPLADL